MSNSQKHHYLRNYSVVNIIKDLRNEIKRILCCNCSLIANQKADAKSIMTHVYSVKTLRCGLIFCNVTLDARLRNSSAPQKDGLQWTTTQPVLKLSACKKVIFQRTHSLFFNVNDKTLWKLCGCSQCCFR